ncbi:MAG TPA: cytochrome c oxidase assembly protein [Pyrinomonadaceae bacterium]|nr:cytochrome c oxidase assembly protein [Pyrinomonadaceae bacterium]
MSRKNAAVQLLCLPMLIVSAALPVVAHEGKPHHPHDLLYTWGLDPLVIISLIVSGWLYARGLRRVWREAGTGHGIKKWEAAAFAGGWFSILVALVSPLHPLGEVLFSAHMTQHELLMLVAAPLTVLGRPVISFLWAMPLHVSRSLGNAVKAPWFDRTWQFITKPLAAWVIHAFSLWVWHAPVLFQATLTSNLIHTIQHIFFLGSALLFWWALIHGPRGAMGYGVAILYVFTTSIHSGVLGALITFAGWVIYPAYSHTTWSWGLTPLEDQQLGGLIMWIPAGVVYIIAGLALFAGWMRESERIVAKREAVPAVLLRGTAKP